jgi:putative ABC transport system substrate-binding protein
MTRGNRQQPLGNSKKLRLLSGALCAALFALCVSAEAQQPSKIPRIGYLSANFASSELARTDAFWQGLRGLGYAEGKNIVIEFRFAEGKRDRVLPLATELVRLKVGVIVTAGTGQHVPPTKRRIRFLS